MSSSMDNDIQRAVKETVDARIRQGIAEALGADPSVIVAAVIDSALHETNRAGYGSRETFLQTAVNGLIRDAAMSALQGWVTENRPLVEEKLREKLGGESKLLDKIVDAVAEGLGKSLYVTANLKVEE